MSRDHEESYETVRSERPLLPQMDHRKKEIAGVLWFTVLFVLAVGVANGDGKQPDYLLPGLRVADPGFLTGDWFTWGVVHSHEAFSILVAGLAETGQLLVALTVGTIVQSAGLAVAFYAVVRAVYDRPLIPWAGALALFASLETASVATAPLLWPQLDASSLAAVALLAGIGLLAWRKFVPAAVAFGLSGLLHPHYAVLLLPFLVAASLAAVVSTSTRGRWRRVGVLWAVYLLLAFPTLLEVVRFSGATAARDVSWIGVSRFPFHLAPWTWPREPFLVLCAALLMGTGGSLLRRPRKNPWLAWILVAVALTVFGSLALGYLRVVEVVLKAWPWRLAPFLLLAGLGAWTAAVAVRDPFRETGASCREIGFGLLFVGIVLMARVSPSPTGHVLVVLCALPVARWAADWLSRRSPTFGWVPAVAPAVVVTLAFGPAVVLGVEQSHFEMRPEGAERAPVYEWATAETPEGAVFSVPPSWGDFRLKARRPVVADWRAVPRYAPDRLEWLRRIRALTGLKEPGESLQAADSAYATMDCERALRLRRRYATRFVVHERPKDLPCGREVYSDSLFRVWELPASDR